MYDVVIIGGGIAGAAVARELSKYRLKVAVLEKENDVANETTMANSAIVHAGYDALNSQLKGKYNAKGNQLYPKLCQDLDVPFKQIGSLVIAFNPGELETLETLMIRGIENGVKGLKIVDKEEVHKMEPNLSDEVLGALYAPTAGIVSSWDMCIALMENAMDNGVELFLEQAVVSIEKLKSSYHIRTSKDAFTAKTVVNCAGVFADNIQEMIGQKDYSIQPRKGEYFIMDKDQGQLINHVIFQCPSEAGKGILVTPTVHGNLLVGPDSEFVNDKNDHSTQKLSLESIREIAMKTTKSIDFRKVIRSFAGLRATSSVHDFIVGESPNSQGFFNVAGFESPGLSAAPAVAIDMAHMVVRRIEESFDCKVEENKEFLETRKPVKRFAEMDKDELNAIIKVDPAYGRIICRCEMVSEGEIVDSIKRNAGAKTVKAVKKRTRAGMGRCQGGFCGPRVVEILSRELKLDYTDVVYDSEKAYILDKETKGV